MSTESKKAINSSMNTMTSRERWLAALKMQPVDRLIFWPKLGNNYPNYRTGEFKGKENDFFFDWIGCDKHLWIHPCVKDVRHNTTHEVIRDHGTMRTVQTTPHGTLTAVSQYDGPSDSWHPVEFPVKSREDILRMTECFEDITVEPDPDELENQKNYIRQIGNDGLTTSAVGESPLMTWVEHHAGVENAHFFLIDYPDETEAMFDAHHRYLLRRAEVIADLFPGDAMYMVENTSTTLISPEQYRQYCLPHLTAYADILKAGGLHVILHMCGHLKQLLPDICKVGAHAYEAFTSPTLGNTTLLDGRTACPDTCLIGGTNAMLWTKSAGEIIAQIEHDLDELPHHRGLAVTSAGVMPPICEPETIREVCEWVKQYPAKMSG